MYRILVEDVNTQKTETLTSDYFESFTVIETKGYWQGKRENSLIIEIETENKEKVLNLANILKQYLDQESVLVQFVLTNSYFI